MEKGDYDESMLIKPIDDLRMWVIAANPANESSLDQLPASLIFELYPDLEISGGKVDSVLELVRQVRRDKDAARKQAFAEWANDYETQKEFSEEWPEPIMMFLTSQLYEDKYNVGKKFHGRRLPSQAFVRAARGYISEEWIDFAAPHKWAARQECARGFRLLARLYGMELSTPTELPSIEKHLTASV